MPDEDISRARREAANLLAEQGMGVTNLTPDALIDLLAMCYLRGGRDAIIDLRRRWRMSERNRYRVQVTREGIVWADNADEAEPFALEEERNWPVVMVDVDQLEPRDPAEEIERRINGNRHSH